MTSRTWRVLLLLLLVVVTFLALTPKLPEGVESGLDKVAHLLAFTSPAFSGYRGFPACRGICSAVVTGLLAYGGLIEVLQVFVPGRSSVGRLACRRNRHRVRYRLGSLCVAFRDACGDTATMNGSIA
jgi:hypothetical protein